MSRQLRFYHTKRKAENIVRYFEFMNSSNNDSVHKSINKRSRKENVCNELRTSNEPIDDNGDNLSSARLKESNEIILDETRSFSNEQIIPDEIHRDMSCDQNKDLIHELASWATRNFVTRRVTNELLVILQKKISNLPVDSRALKKTPRNVDIISIDTGKYIHYGLEDALTDYLSNLETIPELIELDFNIDGLPLSKSSNFQLWPILCNVTNTNAVMMIGVYGGNSKPDSCNEYLTAFVTELKELLNDGFYFNQNHICINLRTFICDAPARSFILNVKGHTGFYSCTRCEDKGYRFRNKTVFSTSIKTLRTNESFRERRQQSHHRQQDPIALESLNIDFGKQFIFDYMHVVCLGVVITMMQIWINGLKTGENRILYQKVVLLTYRIP